MKASKKYWVYSPGKSKKVTPSEAEKKAVEDYFQPLVEDFRKEFISQNPDKKYNYMVDIYSKWYQNYFYLCQKFKSEHPNRKADNFENKFIRLKYTGKDQFEFSYFRHTGKWHVVRTGLTMEECKEMISSIPVFQPIG